MKLTDAAVKAAKPQSGFYDLNDAGSPLFVRVKSNGEKVWFARVRIDGKQTKMRLGEYPAMRLDDARFEAQRLKREAKERRKEEKPEPVHPHYLEPALTVSKALERYDTMKLANLASGDVAKRMIEMYFIPQFGDRELASLRKKEIITHFETLYQAGFKGVGLNRVLANVKAMLNWYAKRGELEVNPAAGIERLVKEKPRDRLLTAWELGAIMNSLDDLSGNYGNAIGLLLHTSCRREDIFGLKWKEVVEREGEVELHIENTKAGVPHIAWVAPRARRFIPERPEGVNPEAHVFTGLSMGGRIYPKMRQAADEAAGQALAHWGLHDFRTACVTYINDLRGRDQFHVAAEAMDMLLAHIPRGVTLRHYNQSAFLSERIRILGKWADHLENCAKRFPSKKNNANRIAA